MAATYKTTLTAEDQTGAAFRSLGRRVASLGGNVLAFSAKVAKIGTAFATAGTVAAAALTKSSMSSIDSLAKTADKIGSTTEALAGLRHAAERTGVSSNTLDMAMQRLTRRVSEAANGTGEAKDALLELGLNAIELEQLPLDTRMEKIADAMVGVKSQADRVRLAMKLFDSEGVALVNTLASGSQGLKDYAKEAEHLGLTISRVDAKQIEMANDAVGDAKEVFTGLGNQLATAFSPIIYGVANGFRQSALDSEDFGTIGQRVAAAVVRSFAAVINVINDIKIAYTEVALLAAKAKEALTPESETMTQFAQYSRDLKEQQDLYKQFPLLSAERQEAEKQYAAWVKTANQALIDGTYEVSDAVRNGAGEAQAEVARLQEELASLQSANPGDALVANFEELQASTRRTAEGIVATTGAIMEIPATVQTVTSEVDKIMEEAEKRRTQWKQSNASERTNIVLNELDSTLSGVAKSNKKLFAVQKAVNIAQAIMNTFRGATLAMASYPPPLNFAMAAATVAAGMAQVQQIRAQSFLGGGFTGEGARAGGYDSKGGQFALVHPGEYILDTKKKGAAPGGVTIVNNVDARGSDESRVRAAIEKASRETIMTIQDLMSRGRFA
jgi:hypothetical protein